MMKRQKTSKKPETESKDSVAGLSPETYNLLLDLHPSITIATNTDGIIVCFNKMSENVSGYSKSEMLGRSFYDKLIPESEIKVIRQLLGNLSVNRSQSQFESHWLTKSGKIRTISWMNALVYDSAAQTELIISTGNDITEQNLFEQSLIESEERHRLVIEQTGFLVYDLDLETNIIKWSGNSTLTTGFPIYEIQNGTLDEWAGFIHPDDRDTAIDKLNHCIRTGQDYLFEYRFRQRNGMYKFLSDKGTFLKDESGKPIRMLGVMSDISERKIQEMSIISSEARFRSVVEQSMDGIFLFDANGVVWVWNNGMETITGIAAQTAIGSRIWDLFDGLLGVKKIPLSREFMKENITRLIDFDMTLDLHIFNKFEILKPSGEYRFAEGSTIAYELKNEKIFGSIIRDVTDKIVAEKELKESEERYKLLFRNAPVGVFEYNTDLVITECNAHMVSMLGLSFNEIIGIDTGKFVLPPAFNALNSALKDNNGSYEGPLLNFNTDPDQIYQMKTAPLYGFNKEIRGGMGLIEDISDRKKSENQIKILNQTLEDRVKARTSQLLAVNEELEAFSYSVSHDLRAPLRSMAGFSRALLEDYADKLDADGKSYLNRILNSGERMSKLIEDILKLSRVTRAQLDFRTFDLVPVIKSIIDDLETAGFQHQINWNYPEKLNVHADSSMMKIALTNLLGNAVKFSSLNDTAHIEIGCTAFENELCYYIKDDGAGFDMTYADKLFSAFQRLHPSTEFEGTGIGLAIVKRIINRHGGRIWAKGEPDNGAAFYFTLSPLTGADEKVSDEV